MVKRVEWPKTQFAGRSWSIIHLVDVGLPQATARQWCTFSLGPCLDKEADECLALQEDDGFESLAI